MNERIKELSEQATNIEYGVDNGFDRVTFDKEKFAELIVADCLKQIKDGLVDESELLYEHEETTECVNEALMDAHHNIAIHFGFAEQFGVEE
jgi:hypothetical protein